ncbi:MAG: shikimate dehydrogenase [Pseudomonadota bacterium]
MSDRYAVFGHPVAHSRSPEIHAEFARSTGQDIRYERILAPLDGFAAAVAAFRAAGGRGANVTLPFKHEACTLATELTMRASDAGAVNTLRFDGERVLGDNTDGAGLVRDLEVNLQRPLRMARVLMLGAGGAAAGVLLPLLEAGIASLHIANRSPGRARALAGRHAGRGPSVSGGGLDDSMHGTWDVVINATSASLSGEMPSLEGLGFGEDALCYDMVYAPDRQALPGPFLQAAREKGARIAEGMGMLVEQAAESFTLWRGVRPDTRALLERMAPAWRGGR